MTEPNSTEVDAQPMSNLCSRPSDTERLVRTHEAEEGTNTKQQSLPMVTKASHTTGKENMKPFHILKGPGRETLTDTAPI